MKKHRKPNDKIFDNKYNNGDIDHEQFDIPTVDGYYSEKYMDDVKYPHETYRNSLLEERVLDCWILSEWNDFYTPANKRIPKEQLSEIYCYFKKTINDSTYTDIEIFGSIADFLNVNYKVLYDSISISYKVELVKELDDKYKILQKKNVVKLF